MSTIVSIFLHGIENRDGPGRPTRMWEPVAAGGVYDKLDVDWACKESIESLDYVLRMNEELDHEQTRHDGLSSDRMGVLQ